MKTLVRMMEEICKFHKDFVRNATSFKFDNRVVQRKNEIGKNNYYKLCTALTPSLHSLVRQ